VAYFSKKINESQKNKEAILLKSKHRVYRYKRGNKILATLAYWEESYSFFGPSTFGEYEYQGQNRRRIKGPDALFVTVRFSNKI